MYTCRPPALHHDDGPLLVHPVPPARGHRNGRVRAGRAGLRRRHHDGGQRAAGLRVPDHGAVRRADLRAGLRRAASTTSSGGGKGGFYAIFYFGAALVRALARGGRSCSCASRRPEDAAGAAAARHRGRRWGPARRRGRPTAPSSRPPILAFVLIAFTSHYAMGAFDVVWSLWLVHLGASMTFISYTWVAFSVPMLLSFVGGMAADRYSRFWLFMIGYALSGVAWIFYGVTTNLTLFIIVNVLRGPGHRLLVPGQAGLPRAGQPASLDRHGDRRRVDGHAARRPAGLAHGADPLRAGSPATCWRSAAASA